ncbi:hypothetical protein V3C99_005242 [Haemonchus contortus]|uniref:Uncharacterized protein n=1 Tax=Haemonchus contortus TaxID=6289 RepID=A0A7I4XWN4_HAECO|nr:unnamed protein product [Haemonchus contortus]
MAKPPEKPQEKDDNVSFTDINADTAAGGEKATGSAMMDLISGLQKQKSSTKTGSGSGASGGGGKRKKKGKKSKKGKKKRVKDRYESQNYLLRIEGTLCCASIIIVLIWLLACCIVAIICAIWSNGDFNATSDSVKDK